LNDKIVLLASSDFMANICKLYED